MITPPITIGGWTIVARLENIKPSELDDSIRSILLRDKFDSWFEEQCDSIIPSIKFTDSGLECQLPPIFYAASSLP